MKLRRRKKTATSDEETKNTKTFAKYLPFYNYASNADPMWLCTPFPMLVRCYV